MTAATLYCFIDLSLKLAGVRQRRHDPAIVSQVAQGNAAPYVLLATSGTLDDNRQHDHPDFRPRCRWFCYWMIHTHHGAPFTGSG